MVTRHGKRSRRSEIDVGSLVTFLMGGTPVMAEVVEDRGFIGWNGRRLLRVRTMNELEEVRSTLEIPEEDVTLVQS